MSKPEIINALKGYTPKAFLNDLVAGVIVGVVALPLAIAFGIASGVPPARGIFTAVVAGFIISALGGSRVQIGGPTGAFVVIVYGIVRDYGYDGLAVATMMAGLMLFLLGAFKLGGLIKFIPYTIITGFTAGIAVVIATSQIGDFLGLTLHNVPGDFVGKIGAYASAIGTVNPWAIGTAVLTLAVITVWPKINRRVPGSLVAIVLITVLVLLLRIPVDTIGSRFGSIPSSLPVPRLPALSFESRRALVPAAISIAVLGAIESLLSAVVADGLTGTKHDSDMELMAQGIANLASPLFGGIPATGAIARTATNIKNGGRTPVAGLIHALTLLLILVALGRFAVYIPMAALSAVLFSVALHMAGFPAIRSVLRGQKSDSAVMIATFAITVLVDLTVAIEIGLILAALFFIKKMGDLAQVKAFKNGYDPGDPAVHDRNSLALRTVPEGVLVFEIEGPLFFGSVQKFEANVLMDSTRYRVLVLRMRSTIYLDAGGLHVLEQLWMDCQKKNIMLLISDIHTQPYLLAKKSGLEKTVGTDNIFGNLDDALARASEILGVPYVPVSHEPTVTREREKNGNKNEFDSSGGPR